MTCKTSKIHSYSSCEVIVLWWYLFQTAFRPLSEIHPFRLTKEFVFSQHAPSMLVWSHLRNALTSFILIIDWVSLHIGHSSVSHMTSLQRPIAYIYEEWDSESAAARSAQNGLELGDVAQGGAGWRTRRSASFLRRRPRCANMGLEIGNKLDKINSRKKINKFT